MSCFFTAPRPPRPTAKAVRSALPTHSRANARPINSPSVVLLRAEILLLGPRAIAGHFHLHFNTDQLLTPHPPPPLYTGSQVPFTFIFQYLNGRPGLFLGNAASTVGDLKRELHPTVQVLDRCTSGKATQLGDEVPLTRATELVVIPPLEGAAPTQEGHWGASRNNPGRMSTGTPTRTVAAPAVAPAATSCPRGTTFARGTCNPVSGDHLAMRDLAAEGSLSVPAKCCCCLEERTPSQTVQFGCQHSLCGGCVLQMRRTYDEQSSTIDLTFDPGTQPSYLAPPCCPQCRHLITVEELAAAAVAAAVDPPSEPAAAAAGPVPDEKAAAPGMGGEQLTIHVVIDRDNLEMESFLCRPDELLRPHILRIFDAWQVEESDCQVCFDGQVMLLEGATPRDPNTPPEAAWSGQIEHDDIIDVLLVEGPAPSGSVSPPLAEQPSASLASGAGSSSNRNSEAAGSNSSSEDDFDLGRKAARREKHSERVATGKEREAGAGSFEDYPTPPDKIEAVHIEFVVGNLFQHHQQRQEPQPGRICLCGRAPPGSSNRPIEVARRVAGRACCGRGTRPTSPSPGHAPGVS